MFLQPYIQNEIEGEHTHIHPVDCARASARFAGGLEADRTVYWTYWTMDSTNLGGCITGYRSGYAVEFVECIQCVVLVVQLLLWPVV